ncbi:unnamed protein product [Peronospora destructor]|uniref:Uncharacterized protein n=1 Tax=Peronospora destructor TaxID=86335 RepID=A0AAV0V2G0_9STRA|nr:unnamed protein product [Peronospora destructor]
MPNWLRPSLGLQVCCPGIQRTEINLATEKDNESSVVVGRSSKGDGIGKPVQIVNVGPGDAVFAIYERGAFLIHARNKKSTLASVLGATASGNSTALKNLTTPAMPNSVIQWETVTATSSVNNDTLDAEAWKSNVCGDDDRERQLIADLSNPQVTSTAAELQTLLGKALKKLKTKRKNWPRRRRTIFPVATGRDSALLEFDGPKAGGSTALARNLQKAAACAHYWRGCFEDDEGLIEKSKKEVQTRLLQRRKARHASLLPSASHCSPGLSSYSIEGLRL